MTTDTYLEEESEAYKVTETKDSEKCVVSTRNLTPGDVILTETPLVFGPKTSKIESGPFPCVGCCSRLDNPETEHCPECLWPVCSKDCDGIKKARYHGFECKILRLRQSQLIDSFYQHYRFDILSLLRVLYLQKNDKESWDNFMQLKCDLVARGLGTEINKVIQEKIEYLEEQYFKPLKAYEHEIGEEIVCDTSNDLIYKIYGILDTNAIEVSEQLEGHAIYPIATQIEQNCISNTINIIDANNQYKLTLKACLPIKTDQHITLMYTNVLWGTHLRQQDLKNRRNRKCTCKRCADPTELGTFLSGLKCIGSKTESCGGMQLPLRPLDDDPIWQCCKCCIKLPNKEIMKFVEHLGKEVDKVINKQSSITELEDVMKKLTNFLNPNHYLLYKIKHKIIQQHGKSILEKQEINNTVLEEKLKMCNRLIDISKRIDPGHARLSMSMGTLLDGKFKMKFKLLENNFNIQNSSDFVPDINELLENIRITKNVFETVLKSNKSEQLMDDVHKNEITLKNWINTNKVNLE